LEVQYNTKRFPTSSKKFLVCLFRFREPSENNSLLPTSFSIPVAFQRLLFFLSHLPIDIRQRRYAGLIIFPVPDVTHHGMARNRGQAVDRFGPLYHPRLTNVTLMHDIHAGSQTSLIARDVLRSIDGTSQASLPLHPEVFVTAYSSAKHEEV
jgi:hypothetical protein